MDLLGWLIWPSTFALVYLHGRWVDYFGQRDPDDSR